MDIESEICRSCGAAGGWSHVCEGIQLGEDGEVGPHLLDLFPALDSVATPSAQPTRQKNRSEISLIHEIERSEMIDREIRISMMERETLNRKRKSQKRRKRELKTTTNSGNGFPRSRTDGCGLPTQPCLNLLILRTQQGFGNPRDGLVKPNFMGIFSGRTLSRRKFGVMLPNQQQESWNLRRAKEDLLLPFHTNPLLLPFHTNPQKR